MSKTADNLVYEVAGILGISVAGEAIGAVEYQTIDGNIDPVLAEISDIAYIGDRDDIPDRYFQTIARLVAIHSAAKFSNAPGNPERPRHLMMAQIKIHEDRLRELASSAPTYEPLRTEFF